MTDFHGALILVVEDDADIALILSRYIEREGMRSHISRDGLDAVRDFRTCSPDLVLLDVRLPHKDGFEVMGALRSQGSTPVIFVTAQSADIDKLKGLGLGADDYVTKPFNPEEVVARVKAVLRRSCAPQGSNVLRHGLIEIQVESHLAHVGSGEQAQPLELTPIEFQLLLCMLRHPERVFTRLELIESSLPDSDALERTVDSHVSNLRRKLQAAGAGAYLQSVRGVGYKVSKNS